MLQQRVGVTAFVVPIPCQPGVAHSFHTGPVPHLPQPPAATADQHCFPCAISSCSRSTSRCQAPASSLETPPSLSSTPHTACLILTAATGAACRALLAFLLWSLGLQALLALHQLVTRQRLQLDRLGVDGLILTTNNTGRGGIQRWQQPCQQALTSFCASHCRSSCGSPMMVLPSASTAGPPLLCMVVSLVGVCRQPSPGSNCNQLAAVRWGTG